MVGLRRSQGNAKMALLTSVFLFGDVSHSQIDTEWKTSAVSSETEHGKRVPEDFKLFVSRFGHLHFWTRGLWREYCRVWIKRCSYSKTLFLQYDPTGSPPPRSPDLLPNSKGNQIYRFNNHLVGITLTYQCRSDCAVFSSVYLFISDRTISPNALPVKSLSQEL